MNCSMLGLPVHHQLPEFTQTHVHWVGDAIQPSHPLSSPSPLAFNLSQHQGLFKLVSSSHQVAKILEFQLQHPSLSFHELKAHFLMLNNIPLSRYTTVWLSITLCEDILVAFKFGNYEYSFYKHMCTDFCVDMFFSSFEKIPMRMIVWLYCV